MPQIKARTKENFLPQIKGFDSFKFRKTGIGTPQGGRASPADSDIGPRVPRDLNPTLCVFKHLIESIRANETIVEACQQFCSPKETNSTGCSIVQEQTNFLLQCYKDRNRANMATKDKHPLDFRSEMLRTHLPRQERVVRGSELHHESCVAFDLVPEPRPVEISRRSFQFVSQVRCVS